MGGKRSRFVRTGLRLLLGGAALLWLLPLLWAAALSIRPPGAPLAAGATWWGGAATLANYRTVLALTPVGAAIVTTLVTVGGILALQLVTVTLAGFAFATMPVRGQRLAWLIVLAQLLVPGAVLVVPMYALVRTLDLFDTYAALILPSAASGLGVVMLRTAFASVPRALDEAAQLDGAGWWQRLGWVYLPHARGTLLAFSLLSVTAHWSDFLWPLLATNRPERRTLTVGLSIVTQYGEEGAQWPLVMAATILVLLPLILVGAAFAALLPRLLRRPAPTRQAVPDGQ